MTYSHPDRHGEAMALQAYEQFKRAKKDEPQAAKLPPLSPEIAANSLLNERLAQLEQEINQQLRRPSPKKPK